MFTALKNLFVAAHSTATNYRGSFGVVLGAAATWYIKSHFGL